MLQKWVGFVLAIFLFFAYIPASAAAVSAETLLRQVQKTEELVDNGSPPEDIKAQVDEMAGMFVKLDLSKTTMTLPGLQTLASEMLGLQMRMQSLRLPQRSEVNQQLQRLEIAFDALANPKTGQWRLVVKEMQQVTDKLLVSFSVNDMKTFQQELKLLLDAQSKVKIAIDVMLPPEQVSVLVSASRFLEQQGAQTTDTDGVKAALHMYKTTLQEINQAPPAASAGTREVHARGYNAQSWWIAAGLIAVSGFLIYRRIKTR